MRRAAAALVCAALVGCGTAESPRPVVTAHTLPSGPGAMAPNLFATASGDVLMSWLERDGDGHALKFARLDTGGAWSDPRTIARGTDWFANWADFPAIVETTGGALVAHWLQKSGPATYAYDVMVVRSTDGGATWSEPMRPHDDGTQTEHGFVSLLPLDDGDVQVVWLDGRNTHGGGHGAHQHGRGIAHGAMTLRTRVLHADGSWGDEESLDDSVCDCCQTTAVSTDRGITVAYRDRTAGEVRDTWLTSRRDGRWTQPAALSDEGWEITACPVNGPMLAARGDRVVAAWFTAADGNARVRAAFSRDGGDSFDAPVDMDAGKALGRVATLWLDDGSALVSWLAAVDGGEAEIRMKRLHPDDGSSPHIVVARSAAARASGFPRIARHGERVLVVWTDPAEPRTLRGALIDPSTPRGR